MNMMGGAMHEPAVRDFQGSGGFGDTGAYVLFKLSRMDPVSICICI
jgi:hypothetical protein